MEDIEIKILNDEESFTKYVPFEVRIGTNFYEGNIVINITSVGGIPTEEMGIEWYEKPEQFPENLDEIERGIIDKFFEGIDEKIREV